MSIFATNDLLAHQVHLADDVGATLHIEPNDTPRAHEATQVWFALTRQGGQSVPLSACDCQLEIKPQADEQASFTPTLMPLSGNTGENLVAASVTFPDVGQYRLVLTGKPAGEQTFTPFELTFDVVVAVGSAIATPPPTVTTPPASAETLPMPTAAPQSSFDPGLGWLPLLIGGLVLVGGGVMGYWRVRSR